MMALHVQTRQVSTSVVFYLTLFNRYNPIITITRHIPEHFSPTLLLGLFRQIFVTALGPAQRSAKILDHTNSDSQYYLGENDRLKLIQVFPKAFEDLTIVIGIAINKARTLPRSPIIEMISYCKRYIKMTETPLELKQAFGFLKMVTHAK